MKKKKTLAKKKKRRPLRRLFAPFLLFFLFLFSTLHMQVGDDDEGIEAGLPLAAAWEVRKESET